MTWLNRRAEATVADLAEFGARVRAYRTADGVTQQDLAEAAGLSRSSIANLEAGRQDVTVTTVLAIAHHLGVAPGDLLPAGGTDVHKVVERLASENGALRELLYVLKAIVNRPLSTRDGGTDG
jgi:transcriptional regulator with XRE-family HTH domain